MTRKLMLTSLALVLALAWAAPALANDQDASQCNWQVNAVQLGKWGNGNKKAGIWPKGSFPIPTGVSERPTWYVNGANCGYAQIVAGGGATMRFLPNSSRYLKDGEANTITLKYVKPPCSGASSSKTVVIDWSKVRPGGYYTFK